MQVHVLWILPADETGMSCQHFLEVVFNQRHTLRDVRARRNRAGEHPAENVTFTKEFLNLYSKVL